MPFNHVGTFLIVGFGKLLNRRLQFFKDKESLTRSSIIKRFYIVKSES